MKFFYRAKKGPQDIQEGHVEASDYRSAVDKILQSGLTPIDVKVLNKPASLAGRDKSQRLSSLQQNSLSLKIFKTDVVQLTRYLADFLGAGVPVLKALYLIKNYVVNSRLEKVVDGVIKGVEGGKPLSAAMGEFPSVFSQTYRYMIQAGELSGSLEESAGRLADFLEKDRDDRVKVVSSFVYPLLILSVGFATLFVLFTWVIPKIMNIFNEMDQAIPLVTQVLMMISFFFSKSWWMILLIMMITSVIFIRWYQTAEGKLAVDRRLFFLPGIGRFIRQIAIARFSRTLATLLKGGIDIVQALKYSSQVVGNYYVKEELRQTADDVAGGLTLSQSMRNNNIFTEADISVLSIGEETGTLASGLFKLALFYEKSNEQIMKVITTMIEPMFILVLGLIVGFVVLAMLMPIFQMNIVIG